MLKEYIMNGILKYLVLFGLVFLNFQSKAENMLFTQGNRVSLKNASDNVRSDTIDILHYEINLNITDFSGQTIFGNTVIQFTPKINGIITLGLDLLHFTIDSVTVGIANTTFMYNDTLLRIQLPTALNILDTANAIVYYHGSPQQDPSGIGGWYWNGNYAFALGVGLTVLPHNFGRMWYPCFDNFVERATYTFNITTSNGKRAFCNGYRTAENFVNADTVVTTWQLDESIPSYLANVAVSDYVEHRHNYISSIYGDTTEVWLIANAADTVNMKNSFINIDTCIAIFENLYGHQLWNKVGFVLVPFSGGALENATNISYPLIAANGSLLFENVMAHEMSHHWFGDATTCQNAEEMWLNEGVAEYSSFVFSEKLYGRYAYDLKVKKNHGDVIRKAHVNDNGYYALNAVPQAYTYGDHSYYKGADVLHTLRSYIGDSLFFAGLKSFISTYKFNDVTSFTLRDHFNSMAGVMVTNFFNDWVFNPGFPHLAIDSFSVVPNGGFFDITVYVRQKLDNAPSYFNNVPFEITLMDSLQDKFTQEIMMSGYKQTFSFQSTILPMYAGVNLEGQISDATTFDAVEITSDGTFFLNNSQAQITLNGVVDSSFLCVKYNWVAPDTGGVNSWQYKLSPNRYWKIDGVIDQGITTQTILKYNGTTNSNGYYDNDLFTDIGTWVVNEDSLVLLYRANSADNWAEYPYYTINNMGNNVDKKGQMELDSLLKGEYVLALRIVNIGISEIPNHSNNQFIYPSPSLGSFNLDLRNYSGNITVKIVDLNGKMIKHDDFTAGKTIPLFIKAAGIYIVSLYQDAKIIGSTKFEVR